MAHEDNQIREAIHASIAATILSNLDTSHRDAILQKSIADTLNDYKFSNGISEVVSAKAAAIAKELVESDAWTARIRTAIIEGFDAYLKNLTVAVEKHLKQSFHGVQGSYGQAGRILADWPDPKKK